MTATDLLFQAPQPASLDLRFGNIYGGVDVYIELTLTATLPAVAAQASLAAEVDNAVSRGPKLWQSGEWQEARPVQASIDALHARMPVQQAEVAQLLNDGAALATSPVLAWSSCASLKPASTICYRDAAPIGVRTDAPFGEMNRERRRELAGVFGEAAALPARIGGAWKVLSTLRRVAPVFPVENAELLTVLHRVGFSRAAPHRRSGVMPWGEARRAPPGVSPHGGGTVQPGQPCYTPPAGNAVSLIFSGLQPASLDLLFVCPNKTPTQPTATIVVPIRSIYMQNTQVTVALADTGQPIPASGLKLSIDADSWCWGWSASVPRTFLGALRGSLTSKVELLASVNGTNFRLAVEKIGSSRSFGKGMLSISGRGRAIWLGKPYADVVSRGNAVAMTAQQLMADALTENGVSNGWSIDWRIDDWLVPAGAWQHRGTAMEACQAIAGAAGAYIQAHRTDQTLVVLPRYPVAPWNWPAATPDLDVPENVCIVEGIEFLDMPAYNTVFVAGQVGGILGHVTRGGTSGDKAAPQVCDALITHADAARQRGLAILGDTGEQKHITLSLPVLNETGIIVPGLLMRYSEGGNTHLGLTRAVEVNHDFPKLTQFVTVESHVL